MNTTEWEPVIGIEVHVELKTASKMFCSCAVGFGEEPNTSVCPTCLGLPGALPVINATAIEWITRIGLAFNCEIAPRSVFHRKNYFYADLPKNYQISQFDLPICFDGWLDVEADGEAVRVGIERAHMEEDTGKSLHEGLGGRIHSATSTLLDFNRSGVPLVEVVSRPDIRSAAQARAYAQELRSVVAELDVSDARMEEGSIRFDANVSVRPVGTTALGTKVEIKNMNSFRSLERAVAAEITRQVALSKRATGSSRRPDIGTRRRVPPRRCAAKKGASDYRYFTEPDLVPMVMTLEWIAGIRERLPELPADRQARYASQGLAVEIAGVLSGLDAGLRRLYDDAVLSGAPPRSAANWVTGEVLAWLRKSGLDAREARLDGPGLAELIEMVDDGSVSSSAAKEVLAGVLSGEGRPRDVADTRDLLQLSDAGALDTAVAEVLAANPGAVEEFRGGEEKVVGFLVGQVMKATDGKADPRMVNQLLRERMSG